MARSTYDDFIIKEKIGSGSYGVVFKVVRKVDKHVYAMKEIDLAGMSRKVRPYWLWFSVRIVSRFPRYKSIVSTRWLCRSKRSASGRRVFCRPSTPTTSSDTMTLSSRRCGRGCTATRSQQ